MKSIRYAVLAGALAVASAPAVAGEVMATVVESGAKKGGTALALDVVSPGGVAGFSFHVEVPGLVEGSADLSKCVSELPKGFTGGCSIAKGAVYVIAWAERPDVQMGAGVHAVGKVYLSRLSGAKGGAIKVSGVEFSDNNANSVSGTAKVLAD